MAGKFIVIDGPNGCGKSTVLRLTAAGLRSQGYRVHETKEPTKTPLGLLAKELDGKTASHTAYACLIAADRHEHSAAVQAHLASNDFVISDRYLSSSLVLNVARGVPRDFILAVNQGILVPDLTVILDATPDELDRRMAQRGQGITAGERLTTRADESERYRKLTTELARYSRRVHHLDTTVQTADETAAQVVQWSKAA